MTSNGMSVPFHLCKQVSLVPLNRFLFWHHINKTWRNKQSTLFLWPERNSRASQLLDDETLFRKWAMNILGMPRMPQTYSNYFSTHSSRNRKDFNQNGLQYILQHTKQTLWLFSASQTNHKMRDKALVGRWDTRSLRQPLRSLRWHDIYYVYVWWLLKICCFFWIFDIDGKFIAFHNKKQAAKESKDDMRE